MSVLGAIFCGPGITCSPVFGYLTVAMAIIVFVGSIYLILASVFGPRMGYLVLAVAFFGWMMIFAALWSFGFYSQGPTTKVNLGPRGVEPHWQPVAAGVRVASPGYSVISRYPGKPWFEPTDLDDPRQASVGTVTTAVQDFLAEQANRELIAAGKEKPSQVKSTTGGTEEVGPNALVQPADFTVTDVGFTKSGHTSLAAAHAVFNGGGPQVTVLSYHDSGNVPVYSYAFLAVSVLGFLVHLPFLDRAERRRKAVLTGGKAPQWLGPA
jgi:hypothetical protein